MVIIQNIHIISTPVIIVADLGSGIADNELYIGLAIQICITPIDAQIPGASKNSIPVLVDEQTVAIGISFRLILLHVIIIINPCDRNAVIDHRFQYIRVAILVQINAFNFRYCRRHPKWEELRIPVPVLGQ